jgi:hypothetical protein
MVVSRINPQISAPTIWMPQIWNMKLWVIEYFRKWKDERLSPVQWPVNLLEPTVVLREIMNGRRPFFERKE